MYGALPVILPQIKINCPEMLFYQYLPVKMAGSKDIIMETRLDCFRPILIAAYKDYAKDYGMIRLNASYIYLTAKCMYQPKGESFNRKGYHSDGFMTSDTNYIWSDCQPTIFNKGAFKLSQDDDKSITQMNRQAFKENEVSYPANTLIRLNQFNIHKVQPADKLTLRTFVKISFSLDKYDLEGNSHNHLIDYKWDLRKREEKRNIPQIIKK
jgi:hypothetical protein